MPKKNDKMKTWGIPLIALVLGVLIGMFLVPQFTASAEAPEVIAKTIDTFGGGPTADNAMYWYMYCGYFCDGNDECKAGCYDMVAEFDTRGVSNE